MERPPGARREPILDEALTVAHGLGGPAIVDFATLHLAPLLAKAGRLADSHRLAAVMTCSAPLAWVAPKLAREPAKRGLIREALRVARATDNERERCRAVLEVAAYL